MPASDVELLADAAREAGRIARRYWREDPEVWDKGDNDPVSEADLAVDTFLKDSLLAARSDYGWVSEETEDDPARLEREHVFIVDPIDGTRAFVAGEPTWAHSLSVVENGQVTAACVYLPVRDKLYLAAMGQGATLNGSPLSASKNADIETSTVLTPRVTFQEQFWKSGVPGFKRHFRPSLAYRLALVGEGRFDAMITLRQAWEWDIAAGALIAAEAGAAVSDRCGARFTFNSPARQTAGVVTASPVLHTKILSALA